MKTPDAGDNRGEGAEETIRRLTASEQAHRQAASHLRGLVQAIPDLVWLKAIDGTYLACNHAFEVFFGASESAIVGRVDGDFVGPELAASFRRHDEAAMAADHPVANEEWLTFAHNAHYGLFHTIKTATRDEAGNLSGVVGVARDITVREEAAARLIASELRYRRLFESAKDGILILDAATGMVVDVNP